MSRVGYLGPAGTFSHEALLAAAPDAEAVPFATVHEVVVAVQDGRVDRGLVPVENSVEGAVNATLDALAFDAPDVWIVGEEVLEVHHHLIAAGPIALDEVRLVISHPQPLAQCARFLREQLPGATTLSATSTAEAVRALAASDPRAAAIGTRSAAERYGMEVLAEDVEDEASNVTRFAWIAGDPMPFAAATKTSVLFHGAGDASPGWLVRCLSEFAFRGVNLTRIESRPLRSQLGHYLFHVDLEAAGDRAEVQDAIGALRQHCEEVRVLGSYAAAPARVRRADAGPPADAT